MKTIDSIKDEDVDLSLLKDIPLAFCKTNLILPLRLENGSLLAAVTDENSIFALKELSENYSVKPSPFMMDRDL
ncbi:MAG: hypothetical protein V3V59_08140, partial [Thermodesulfovibrionales bacterium]